MGFTSKEDRDNAKLYDLIIKMINSIRQNQVFRYPIPLVRKESCIVCGMIRFDPDSTGLTCGNLKCLASLGDKIYELNEKIDEREQELGEIAERVNNLEEEIIEIALWLDIDTQEKEIFGISKEIKTAAKRFYQPEKLKEIKKQIQEIADLLGIEFHEDCDLELLCKEIRREIQRLTEGIRKLQKIYGN